MSRRIASFASPLFVAFLLQACSVETAPAPTPTPAPDPAAAQTCTSAFTMVKGGRGNWDGPRLAIDADGVGQAFFYAAGENYWGMYGATLGAGARPTAEATPLGADAYAGAGAFAKIGLGTVAVMAGRDGVSVRWADSQGQTTALRAIPNSIARQVALHVDGETTYVAWVEFRSWGPTNPRAESTIRLAAYDRLGEPVLAPTKIATTGNTTEIPLVALTQGPRGPLAVWQEIGDATTDTRGLFWADIGRDGLSHKASSLTNALPSSIAVHANGLAVAWTHSPAEAKWVSTIALFDLDSGKLVHQHDPAAMTRAPHPPVVRATGLGFSILTVDEPGISGLEVQYQRLNDELLPQGPGGKVYGDARGTMDLVETPRGTYAAFRAFPSNIAVGSITCP